MNIKIEIEIEIEVFFSVECLKTLEASRSAVEAQDKGWKCGSNYRENQAAYMRCRYK